MKPLYIFGDQTIQEWRADGSYYCTTIKGETMRENNVCPDCNGGVNAEGKPLDCRTCNQTGVINQEPQILDMVDETLEAIKNLEKEKVKDIKELNEEEDTNPPPQTS